MEVLAPYRSDPYWHLRVDLNLRERVLARKEQRAYLARYGRQDMFRRDLSVLDLDAAVAAVSKIVEKENELSRASEDH